MFTLVGFTESQDSAVLVNVAALADPHIRVSGDDVIVPEWAPQIVGVYAVGTAITRVQLVSPSQRRFVNYEVQPIDRGAEEPASPAPLHDRRFIPLELEPEEALNAQAAEDGVGASRATVLVWLADGAITPIDGDIRTVRATGTTTLVANAWTNGSVAFDQTLPAGEYSLVGARILAAGLQAARFVFVGGQHRPGVIGCDAVSDLVNPAFRYGGMGELGRFRHNTPPTVDYLSNSADTAETLELDLIKLS